MSHPTISLYGLQGLGLIVKHAWGVRYSNQAGGVCCCQPVAEGVLVPLDDHCEIEAKLGDYFADHGGRLGPDDADALDKILQTPTAPYVYTPTFFLAVDRDRLADSMEPWLHVTIASSPEDDPSADWSMRYPMSGFGRALAVLTWANSD